MSITIKLKKTDNCEEDQPHFIPARVNKDSPADVARYFDQFTQETDGVLQNSLRGHPLVGSRMSVPESWQGVVYVERKRPLNEDVDRVFQQKSTFDTFTYFNFDKNPSRNDAFAQALQWLEISDVLHAPEKTTSTF